MMYRTMMLAAMAAVFLNNAASAQERYAFKCLERAAKDNRIFSRILGARADVYPTQADYPWMVNLWGNIGGGRQGAFCGGALIDTDLVVTAAHCLIGKPFSVRRIASDGSPRGEMRQVVTTRKHEQYRESARTGNDYDIALIRVDRPFNIQRLQLPVIQSPRSELSKFFGQPGDCVRVIGWGATSWNRNSQRAGPGSDRLLAADIRVWNEASCSAAYPNATTMQDKICAGYPEGKTDSCQGDSGGPLFAKGGITGTRLVGIVSYGAGCGVAGRPGVYARLSALRDWIASTAKGM